jgi:hydrogenase maturation protease
MTPLRILVAGVGNIFLGDEGFGPAAVQELLRAPLPAGVTACNFSNRSHDLGYAIAQGWEVVVFLAASVRGAAPGSLSVVELDPDGILLAGPTADSRCLHPALELQLATGYGPLPPHLYLVACEPTVLECHDGELALSRETSSAVTAAAELTRDLLAQFVTLPSAH